MPIGEFVMRETLLGLAYPLILSASFVFAAVSCWWRRRQRRRGRLPGDVFPGFYGHRARTSREERVESWMRTAREADRIVLDEYERIAPLYEEPTRSAPVN
ncbi:hypothetical protein [Streptomyces sp. NPDC007991]|uniref:hypothetical protein n=1 Tax=Streptomyces sp. NPDC007991 TaxID=3364803 RepID=UPI0036F0F107